MLQPAGEPYHTPDCSDNDGSNNDEEEADDDAVCHPGQNYGNSIGEGQAEMARRIAAVEAAAAAESEADYTRIADAEAEAEAQRRDAWARYYAWQEHAAAINPQPVHPTAWREPPAPANRHGGHSAGYVQPEVMSPATAAAAAVQRQCCVNASSFVHGQHGSLPPSMAHGCTAHPSMGMGGGPHATPRQQQHAYHREALPHAAPMPPPSTSYASAGTANDFETDMSNLIMAWYHTGFFTARFQERHRPR